LFGGSTTWGVGARDPFTIPAEPSRALSEVEPELRVHVLKFGEKGYVSTQSLLALLLELREGRAPDLAVFYDGVNDVFAGYQQGVAGLPQNEHRRVREFNLSNPSQLPERAVSLLRDLGNELRSLRYLRRVARRWQGDVRPPIIDWCHISEEGNRRVARAMLPEVRAELRAAAERNSVGPQAEPQATRQRTE